VHAKASLFNELMDLLHFNALSNKAAVANFLYHIVLYQQIKSILLQNELFDRDPFFNEKLIGLFCSTS
jgi:hypothetical protein